MASSHPLLGALAAFGSSCTWAYASARYAGASRDVGSTRVNLARSIVVLPIYFTAVALTCGGHPLAGVSGTTVGWLFLSVLCSYGLADSLFFASARRLGVSTALSIASTYPLWAAMVGVMLSGERFGVQRAIGTAACVGGVAALVRLSAAPVEKSAARANVVGVLLACATSILWAGNTVSIKHGAVGISVWQANAIRYPIAFVILSTQVLLGRDKPARDRPFGGWSRLVPAILADAFLGSVLYVYGLANTDLATGATLSSQAPLLSVPVAIALGEEKWSPSRFAAILVTVTGIVLLILAE